MCWGVGVDVACKKGSVVGGGGENMTEHSGRLFGGVNVE